VKFLKHLKGEKREHVTRGGECKELPGSRHQQSCGKEKAANALMVSSCRDYKESSNSGFVQLPTTIKQSIQLEQDVLLPVLCATPV